MKKVLSFLFAFLFVANSFANDIAANVTNPVCDNATLEKYNGTANVEIDWVPNVINLSWYDGDTLLSVPAESLSCIYDGDMYIPPAPTKTGYTFKGWEIKKIMTPSGYTQLKYIETSGTQYINTGYNPNDTTKVETKVQLFDTVVLDWPMIFGAVANGSSRHYSLYGSDQSRNRLYYTYGSTQYGDNDIYASYSTIGTPQYYTDYTLNTEKNTLIVNDRVYHMGITPTFNIDNPLFLFAQNHWGSALHKTAERMYYINIWDNGNLVRRMVPARRNSDSVLGMYDVITGNFYTNAGTGEFIAGPDAH